MDITPAELIRQICQTLAVGVPFWLWLVWLRHTRRQILPCEDRRPVPWQGIDVLLVFALFLIAEMVCFGLGFSLSGVKPPKDPEQLTAQQQYIYFGSDAAARLITLCLAIAILQYRRQATSADLGFVARKVPFDLACGVIAFMATAPILYVLQIVLQVFVVKYNHPLIEAVEKQQDPSTWLLVAFSAVIVAPLVEEFFFRGLLQGWLEKVELGSWPAHGNPTSDLISTPAELPSSDAAVTASLPLSSPQPPPRGIFNLPLGTVPILISSFCFALTHLGQGAAPIPLFVLALVLGFLYQRTHRLLPSIVVHFLLNGFTMYMLFTNGK